MSKGGSLLIAGILVGTLGGCAPTRDPYRAAPLPPLAAPGVATAEVAPAYRLRAGDLLRVKFLFHPELDVKVPIREDGRIDIQGVGEVDAQGKTAVEVARDIEQISSDHLREPQVTVIVAELGPHSIYVGGEVRLPGPVPFREGMTPLQAIINRGGFTDVARTDRVFRGTWKGDRYEVTRLDLQKTVKDGTPEETTLAVNDVLYVQRTWIGDADSFVQHWFRDLIPIQPRAGVGVGITP